MILCCGEALIDFVPRETRAGALAFQPMNGGSIYNTAIALGRLGAATGFFGGLSSDFFGDQLREGLAASHVDYSLSPESARSTVLAFVKLASDGQARYSFIDEGSAARMLDEAQLPVLGDHIQALHTGSISLVLEPCATAFEALVRREAARRVVSYDPNIRPTLIKDRAAVLARLARMAALADLIKLSDEDLEWIAPGAAADAVAAAWLKAGAKVVTVTRGAEGAAAFTARERVEIAGINVTVADTIGAGDTFTAGMLTALSRRAFLTKPALAALGAADLRAVLEFAARAAAITVSRPGADPPWSHEID